MAKKVKWDSDYDEDINIIGISCHKIDYWITFHINQALKIELTRQPDLLIYNQGKGSSTNYPLFHFIKPAAQTSFSLISNHNPEGKLFPDQKSFDYFLIISSRLKFEENLKIIAIIKKVPQVLTAHDIDLKKIKNLPEFISDLELHMIEIAGKKKSKS